MEELRYSPQLTPDQQRNIANIQKKIASLQLQLIETKNGKKRDYLEIELARYKKVLKACPSFKM